MQDHRIVKRGALLWPLLLLLAGCVGQVGGPSHAPAAGSRQPSSSGLDQISCDESAETLHRQAAAAGDGELVCAGTHFGWIRQRQLDEVPFRSYHSVAISGKPDGSERAFVAQHMGAPRILQRQPNGAVVDRCAGGESSLCQPTPLACPPKALGVGLVECNDKEVSVCPAGDRHGLAIGDLTDDGEPDLVIASGARCGCGYGPNEFFPDVQDGAAAGEAAWLPTGEANPDLEEFTAERRRSRSFHLADVDRDGDVDLFMLNNPWCGRLDHDGPSDICSIDAMEQDCESYDNLLLLNQGSHSSGLPKLRAATEVDGGFDSSAAGWAHRVYHHGRALLVDLDLDNAPELVLGGPGFAVFSNEKGKGWRRYATPVRGAALDFDVRDMAAGDVDGDGDADVVVVGVASSNGQRVPRFALLQNDTRDPFHCGGQRSLAASPLRLVPTPVVNDGLRRTPQAVPFGVTLGDVNNDGDLDIVISNVDAQDENKNQPNHLLINIWDTRKDEQDLPQCWRYGWVFAGRSAASGVEGPAVGAADGAVFWDIDADGRQDLLLLNGRGPTRGPLRQLRNLSQSEHSWVRVLVSLSAGRNRNGIGARIEVEQPTMTVTRWIEQPRWQAIGLGSADTGDVTVRVTWPDGRTALRCVKKKSEIVIDSIGGGGCAE